MPRTVRRVAGLTVCMALAGCAPDGLAFRVDDRLTFVSPTDRATVTLPLTVDWEIKDFEVTAPGGAVARDKGYFGVFLDTSPMPPGRSLEWLVRKDRSCRSADSECLTPDYLNPRGVYTTTDTQLELKQVPRTGSEERRERHRVTVVLLNARGARIGESAFELAFDVERKDLP